MSILRRGDRCTQTWAPSCHQDHFPTVR